MNTLANLKILGQCCTTYLTYYSARKFMEADDVLLIQQQIFCIYSHVYMVQHNKEL